jgi:cobalamin biosynthesis Mg chelatase CobN
VVGSDGSSTTAVGASDAGSVISGSKKLLKRKPKVPKTIMENVAVQTWVDSQQVQKSSRRRRFFWVIIVVLLLFSILFGILWTQLRRR